MKTLLIAIFTTLSSLAIAQPPEKLSKQERMEMIETAKIGYITKRINLSPTQAEKFWPVYNEYAVKKKELHKRRRKLKRKRNQGIDGLPQKELEQMLEELFKIREAELKIDVEYKDQFLKVISIQQLMTLYEAEKDFLKMLRKKVEENNRPPIQD